MCYVNETGVIHEKQKLPAVLFAQNIYLFVKVLEC